MNHSRQSQLFIPSTVNTSAVTVCATNFCQPSSPSLSLDNMIKQDKLSRLATVGIPSEYANRSWDRQQAQDWSEHSKAEESTEQDLHICIKEPILLTLWAHSCILKCALKYHNYSRNKPTHITNHPNLVLENFLFSQALEFLSSFLICAQLLQSTVQNSAVHRLHHGIYPLTRALAGVAW